MDLAWLSLGALLLVVAVSCTARANPGVIAIVLAWTIAVYAAPWFGSALDVATVMSAFPSDLFLTLVGVCLLFTQAEVNGTLGRVAHAAQRLCRGNRGLIPIMFFLLAFCLGSVGPGNIAVAGLIAPVAMAAAVRARIPPLLMALMVGHGAIACTLSPITAAGIVANKILADMGLTGHEWRVYAANALANAAVACVGFLLFGGATLFRPRGGGTAGAVGPHGGESVLDASGTVPGAEHFELRHWGTIAVIAGLITAVVAGKAHIGMAAFAGAALLSLLRLADERETFLRLPWSVIVMVCGVSTLAALLEQTGGTQRFAELIQTVSTPRTLPGVLAFVAGIVSVYSSTTGVVLPAFLPMVKNLVEAQPGSDALGLALSVLVGGNLVDLAPLSTIGALCVAAAPASVDRGRLFSQLLIWGMSMSLVGGVACWAWFGRA